MNASPPLSRGGHGVLKGRSSNHGGGEIGDEGKRKKTGRGQGGDVLFAKVARVNARAKSWSAVHVSRRTVAGHIFLK